MSKIIKKGKEVEEKLLSGVSKAVDTIKTTVGPSGKCVAIANSMAGSDITRDGATVAKAIELSDPIENLGASLVKEAASRTEDAAGDATSTTSVLIKEFLVKGRRAISNGANVNELKAGMLKAETWMKDYIKSHAIQVGDDLEKIHKVATISANNDPAIGDL
jgi:chaperonin GroEL